MSHTNINKSQLTVSNKLKIPISILNTAETLALSHKTKDFNLYIETQIQAAYNLGVEQGLLEALTKLRQELG